MKLFPRTKGLIRKVFGADEHLGQLRWSVPAYDVRGEFKVLRTQAGDKLLSGRIVGGLRLVFEEFDSDLVDSAIRSIGEAVRITIQSKELEDQEEPKEAQSKGASANGAAAH